MLTSNGHLAGTMPGALPLPPPPVTYKGQHFVGLTSRWDGELGTRRFTSVQGLLPPDAELFLPLLHGMGPTTSHAGSMFAILNTLTASKKKRGRSQSLKMLKTLPCYRVVGAEAIDLPGCHELPVPEQLMSLDNLVDWTHNWLQPIKRAEQVPLVPVARSASATIVAELNRRYPDLLDGIVMLSPMLPSDAGHSNNDLLTRVAAGGCQLNQVAFDFMNAFQSQSSWDKLADPIGKTPTLIFTGEEDRQVSLRVRQQADQWSRRNPHVQFMNVEGIGHDVLNLRCRRPACFAYELLYKFLADILEDEQR